MKSNKDAVLLVADGLDMLLVARAVLTGRGYRVLLARNAESAVEVLGLRQFPIAAVVIHSAIGYSKNIELACLLHGVNVHFMSGFVEEGIIRLRLPELGSYAGEVAATAAGVH